MKLVVDNVADIKGRLKQLKRMEKALMPRINMFVSDLFFNLDTSDCYTEEEGYDRAKLMLEAVWFLECLVALGCTVPLPTPVELTDDFLERI